MVPLNPANHPRVGEASKHILPPKKNVAPPVQPGDKRRIKSMMVPVSYVADQIRGYQGDADKFSVYRISPGLLPSGYKLAGCWYEHKQNAFFFHIEHPSFPESDPTKPIEAVAVTIDELDVMLDNSAQNTSGKPSELEAIVRPVIDMIVDAIEKRAAKK